MPDLQKEISKKTAETVNLDNSILDLQVNELVAKANLQEVSDKVIDKKNELDGIETTIANKGIELGKIEASIREWSNKVDSEEVRAKEAMQKVEIAEEVYDMMMANPEDEKYGIKERSIELTYENEQLKVENKTLREKLQ